MTHAINPYANESQVLTVDTLSFENGIDVIAIHGSIDVTRDRAGLEKARIILAQMESIVSILERTNDLPDAIANDDDEGGVTKNPFDG